MQATAYHNAVLDCMDQLVCRRDTRRPVGAKCNVITPRQAPSGLVSTAAAAELFTSLQVLRIRSRAFACLSLRSSVRKLEKNRSGS
jgi:hypothetical protein